MNSHDIQLLMMLALSMKFPEIQFGLLFEGQDDPENKIATYSSKSIDIHYKDKLEINDINNLFEEIQNNLFLYTENISEKHLSESVDLFNTYNFNKIMSALINNYYFYGVYNMCPREKIYFEQSILNNFQSHFQNNEDIDSLIDKIRFCHYRIQCIFQTNDQDCDYKLRANTLDVYLTNLFINLHSLFLIIKKNKITDSSIELIENIIINNPISPYTIKRKKITSIVELSKHFRDSYCHIEQTADPCRKMEGDKSLLQDYGLVGGSGTFFTNLEFESNNRKGIAHGSGVLEITQIQNLVKYLGHSLDKIFINVKTGQYNNNLNKILKISNGFDFGVHSFQGTLLQSFNFHLTEKKVNNKREEYQTLTIFENFNSKFLDTFVNPHETHPNG